MPDLILGPGIVDGIKQTAADINASRALRVDMRKDDVGLGSIILENVTSWFKIPFNVKFDDAEFNVAALSATKNIITLNARSIIHGARGRLITEFKGGAISAVALDLGVSGTPARYMSGVDVFTTIVSDSDRDKDGVDLASTGIQEAWTVTTILQVTLTSVTANLDALTQGEISLDLYAARRDVEI